MHGIDLDVRRGRVLALVGESGSGKSVTAQSVLRLHPPDVRVGGRVLLGDDDLLTVDGPALRAVRGARVGTVFQEPMAAWNPVHRIGRQVEEALQAHGRARGGSRATVLELLASVGLDEPERIAASYPHELSGGQLQRAMIAMATGCEPELLIADEPTTALDVTVQAGILDLLRGLAARGTAVLLITHDMGVVADLADDVAVMHDGRVVERGPVEAVLGAPREAYTRTLLAAVPTFPEDRSPAARPESREVVRLEQVGVRYGRGAGAVHAVRGVDLTIRRGETLGLVGESGSGKSTLGRTLTGLVRPTEGRATLDGTDLTVSSPGPPPHPAPRGRHRLPGPELLAEPAAHRRPLDRRAPAAGLRVRRGRPGPGSPTCSRRSTWTPASRAGSRTSSPAASDSASRSHGHWCCVPSSSWPTSRPARSTSRCRHACSRCWAGSRTSSGSPACSSPTTSPWWVPSPTASR